MALKKKTPARKRVAVNSANDNGVEQFGPMSVIKKGVTSGTPSFENILKNPVKKGAPLTIGVPRNQASNKKSGKKGKTRAA